MSNHTNRTRRRIIGSALATVVAPSLLTSTSTHAQSGSLISDIRLSLAGKVPSFDGATEWLNSPRLTPVGLQGKVVLVNVCTYSCINWLRQLPYVRAWSEKYGNQRFIVLGVHSPEFEFEKNIDNVRRAISTLKISYPVAIDNDFAVWRALNNHAWPALFFVDMQGRIRHMHFGEGDYARSETIIQQLLAEGGSGAFDRTLVSINAGGAEAQADWGNLRSPETYIGYGRAERFSSSGVAARDSRRVYTAPSRLMLNHWGLSGDWSLAREFATVNTPSGQIAYQFHSRDVHLVMGPTKRGASARFRVRIDGQSPGANHGTDVDAQGNGVVTEQRLFQLVRQQSPIRDRRFEIEFVDPGVETYAFTFG